MVRVVLWTWAVLGLAGCFGDGRPLDEYLRDERRRRMDAGASGPDAAVAPDEFPPPACSQDGGGAVQVTFVNRGERTVDVLWVDAACDETPYRTLSPGEQYVQSTFARHPWRVRDAVTREILIDFPGAEAAGTTQVVIE